MAAAAAAADDDGAADLRRGRAGRRAAVGEGTDREDGAAVVVAAVSGLDIPAFAAGEGRSLSHPADHLDREGLASGDDGREAAALTCRSRSDLGRGHLGRHLRDRLPRPPPDGAAAAEEKRRVRPRQSGSAWPWSPPPPALQSSSAAGDSLSGARRAIRDWAGRCPTTPAATRSALRRYWDSCICRTKSLRGTWGSWPTT